MKTFYQFIEKSIFTPWWSISNSVREFTCKFNMELILRFEYLHIKRAVWCKVLHCPSSQNGLMVLGEKESKIYLYGSTNECLQFWITACLTAAMRSTSFRLLRMKQASASSILHATEWQHQTSENLHKQWKTDENPILFITHFKFFLQLCKALKRLK